MTPGTIITIEDLCAKIGRDDHLTFIKEEGGTNKALSLQGRELIDAYLAGRTHPFLQGTWKYEGSYGTLCFRDAGTSAPRDAADDRLRLGPGGVGGSTFARKTAAEARRGMGLSEKARSPRECTCGGTKAGTTHARWCDLL